jgi:hypothetical protein
MARTTTDCLARAEIQLDQLTRGNGQVTMAQWRDACADLAGAPLNGPRDLQAWLRSRPATQADAVLRGLVTLAQKGDAVALLAVVVCLAPGIRALARRTGIAVDEAMSEVTLGILEYPVERRQSVAGGLLLDARNRLGRAARRTPEPHAVVGEDAAWVDANSPAAGGQTTAERILALVCDARRRNVLDGHDAQLIVDTRVSGHRVAPAAARLGISRDAAYQRRIRAERRLREEAGVGVS